MFFVKKPEKFVFMALCLYNDNPMTLFNGEQLRPHRTLAAQSVAPPVYPPEPVAHWERARGVYDTIIDTPDHLTRVARELKTFPFSDRVTRHSVLYAVTNDALTKLEPGQRAIIAEVYENAIPLSGSGVNEIDYLINMSHNHPGRRSNPAVINEQFENVRRIFTFPHKETHNLKEFQIGILTPEQRQNEKIQEQIKRTYCDVFGYTLDEVAAMLTSDNMIAAAFLGDEIVSAGVVEFSPIIFRKLNGEEINVSRAELTDGVVMKDYASKGVYTGVSNVLLKGLAQLAQQGSVHVVFSESNLESPGVFRVAHKQGRQLPPDNLHGLQGRPLIQSCGIPGGKNGHGEQYNNLLPTYLIAEQLIRNSNEGLYD